MHTDNTSRKRRCRHATRAISRTALGRRLGALLAVVWSLALPAQSSDPSLGGRLSGTVRGEARGASIVVPLSYAVVSLPQRALERFTDGGGRFLLTDIPAGRHEVVVRRLGYTPYRGTVTISAGQTTVLDVQLEIIPVRIATLTVQAMARCSNPGLPDARTQPEVALLVSLLRENAQRHALLSTSYPVVYEHVRVIATAMDARDRTAPLRIDRVEAISDRSVTRVQYKPGGVVTRDNPRSSDYTMALPTILDLADDAFARVHCFGFGGREQSGGETWLRLDVRASDRLRSPDVHGSFWLDSASMQLRRMEVELSRPDRLPSSLRHVENVRVQTRYVELAPGLSILQDICAVTDLSMRARAGQPVRRPVELQTLRSYAFAQAPSGVPPTGQWPTPRWRPGASLARSAVWCLEQ